MPTGRPENGGYHRPQSSPPPELVQAGETWRTRAACHNHPTFKAEMWDETVHTDDDRLEGWRSRRKRVATAAAVCRTECPVREQCLRDVDLEWDTGVRGQVDLRELRGCGDCRRLWSAGVPVPDLVALHRLHEQVAS